MATISGTIRGVTCMSKTFSGHGAREAWLITVDFGAYTGASDDASIAAVGAACSAAARDGKTRTLRGGTCIFAGADTANQAVYPTGASVQAMTVSSDALTGNLSNAAGTELTSATASKGAGILVVVDAS